MTQNLEHQLFKDLALEHGFSLSGICRAEIEPTAIQRFLKWIKSLIVRY